MKNNPTPLTKEQKLKKTLEQNKEIIPILLSGFRYKNSYDEHHVADQIREIIHQAALAERERIVELVQINQKGQFDDGAGNICWYLDDLLKALEDNK